MNCFEIKVMVQICTDDSITVRVESPHRPEITIQFLELAIDSFKSGETILITDKLEKLN